MNLGSLFLRGLVGKLKGIGILVVLFSAYWIYDSFGDERAAEKLAKEGKEVTGLITEGKVETLKHGIKLYSITVIYQLPGQDSTTKPFGCTEKFIQSHIHNGALVNPNVNIRYIESHPETATLVQGENQPNHSGERYWIFAIGVGMVTICSLLDRKLKAPTP